MSGELPEDGYPVLNPAYVPVRSDDVVYVRAGPWSGSVSTVRNEPAADGDRLFDLLDGDHTLSEILDRVGHDEDVREILRRLGNQNVLYFLDDESNYPVPRIPIQSNKEPVVDSVSSDLHFTLATDGDVGDVVTDYLTETGVSVERIDLTGPEDVAGLDAEESDFLVYLSTRDRPDVATRLNQRALEAGLPWLVGQVNGFDAVVGPTMVPPETSCYRCYLDRVEANAEDDLFVLYREGTKQITADRTFTPLEHLVESYVCLELSHVLQFGQGFTVERTFTVSGTNMTTHTNDVLKAPRCSACSDVADKKRFVGHEDVARWRRR